MQEYRDYVNLKIDKDDKVLFLSQTGSSSNGLKRPSSDNDLFVVVQKPLNYYMSLRADSPFYSKQSNENGYDITLVDLGMFLQNIAQSKLNTYSSLFGKTLSIDAQLNNDFMYLERCFFRSKLALQALHQGFNNWRELHKNQSFTPKKYNKWTIHAYYYMYVGVNFLFNTDRIGVPIMQLCAADEALLGLEEHVPFHQNLLSVLRLYTEDKQEELYPILLDMVKDDESYRERNAALRNLAELRLEEDEKQFSYEERLNNMSQVFRKYMGLNE